MTATTATDRRRLRKQVLKERRASGKLKPFVSAKTKQDREKVQQLIRANEKAAEERKKARLAEKKLRQERAQKQREERLAAKKALCTDAYLKTLLETMSQIVPTFTVVKNMTSKDFTLNRKAMNMQWNLLRKYLVTCNKTHFNSVKVPRVKRQRKASSPVVFTPKSMHLPYIGADVIEPPYIPDFMFELIGNRQKKASKAKKKRITPTLVK